MVAFKKVVYLFAFFVILALAAYVLTENYSYIFSHHVTGRVVDVQRVNSNIAVVNGTSGATDSAMFSFAVAIRDSQGIIHTASSEDRQWAVVKEGRCADATFYPYPPWNLQKSGTYANARLNHQYDCPPDASNGPLTAPLGTPAGP